jgi:hypothetical protein
MFASFRQQKLHVQMATTIFLSPFQTAVESFKSARKNLVVISINWRPLNNLVVISIKFDFVVLS